LNFKKNGNKLGDKNMRLFDILKRKNKKADLFSITCNYDGYDFVFKNNITNPAIYE
jgi:hypothetical protein